MGVGEESGMRDEVLGRVLWVSESPRIQSGFGRVTRELAARLAKGRKYEVGVLGWEAQLQTTERDPAGYMVLPPGPRAWSPERIARAIDEFAPDVVVASGPLSALHTVASAPNRAFVRCAGHACFEAGPLPESTVGVLAQMDQVVVPSQWCKQVADRALSAQVASSQGPDRLASQRTDARSGLDEATPAPTTPAEAAVVPLGVDARVFCPLPDRLGLRAAAGLEGRFVVGCVARNLFRKQIPILLRAFARFAQDRADAFLYLHMDPDDQGWRLLELVRRHGLSQRVAFTRGLAGAVGVSDASLNMIYNLFDVMVLPTMGEAFGLPLLEAMAAGIPVVATDCSAVTELVGGQGELVRVREWLTLTWDGAEYALADADDIASRLDRLYADRELLAEYSRRGMQKVREFAWERSAEGWSAVIDRLIRPLAVTRHPGRTLLRAVAIA